jgi:hypothetical protein
MIDASLLTGGFEAVTGRLGGPAYIEKTAQETRAFVRGREIGPAVVLLRLILSYCLGGKGLRSTAAWAASLGLADISNVALLYRLRQCGDWLSLLVSHALSSSCPKAAQARTIRIVDGTTVPKAGQKAKRNNGLWRLHSAFDLPLERFSHFELTDEGEGERLDRIPVAPGEIRASRTAPILQQTASRLCSRPAAIPVFTGTSLAWPQGPPPSAGLAPCRGPQTSSGQSGGKAQGAGRPSAKEARSRPKP